MKSILIPIHPEWCVKICNEIGKDTNGKPIYEKSIEVRNGSRRKKVLVWLML